MFVWTLQFIKIQNKICGIKSATDRCKYNASIPVEVELKNSYNICKRKLHVSQKSDLSRFSFIPDRTNTIWRKNIF